MRTALVCYGLLNGILYASLLPLWEGFDEPFHYGYVQSLSHGCGLPVLKQTTISPEIWRSLALAPGSQDVKKNLSVVMTFGEWFGLDPATRTRLRGQLESLRLGTACESGGPLNYEAQQAPLAYALLAGPDYIWRGQPLMRRLWLARMLCAIGCSVATALLSLRLARQLRLREEFAAAAVFVVLSSQMFYAATAHVTNDWLGVPLVVLVMSVSIDAWERPGRASAVALGAVLGAGLLTKAYFLSCVPFAFGLVAWLAWKRRLQWGSVAAFAGVLLATGGPWYARNIVLYGSLSAMQETVHRGSLWELASAAMRLPWGSALLDTARASLWTGNNSFTAFSSGTLTLMLAAIVAAAVLYCAGAWRIAPSTAERVVLSGAGCFAAALAYSAVVNSWTSRGAMIIASPWYVQVLVPTGLCLLFLGLARGGLAGRIVAVLFVGLWAYVISVTYMVKLIPLYSGYAGRASLATIAGWYGGSLERIREALANTAMCGPDVLFALTGVVVACAFVLAALLASRLLRSRAEQL